MANPDYSDELLATLSDDERAALLDPELEEGDEDETEDDIDEGEEGADTETDTDDGTAPRIEDKAAASAEPEVVMPSLVEPRSALPDYKLPEDFQARMDAIATSEDELAKRFDDGELSGQEFQQQLRDLNNQRNELDRLQLKAELSTDARQHDFDTRKGTWFQTTVPEWLNAHPQYEAGTAGYHALNAEVMRLQAEDGVDPFATNILDRAHAKVQADMRKALGIADDPAPAKTEQEKPQRREMPPALGTLPNATGADVEDTSRFAAISRLTGEAKENAMARLSDVERDQYLASDYA